MATVTGLTAARTLELLDTMIVGAEVVAGDLILTKEDGSTVNAGPVEGPMGATGPEGDPGPQGPSGGGSFTLITLGPDVTVVDPHTIQFGAAGWGSSAYSREGFARGCWCSARVNPALDHVMFGLTSDPEVTAGFADIDYAIYVTSAGIVQAYENGVNTVLGPTATSADVLSMTYDGMYIRYWMNGVLLRTVVRPIGLPLYFDCSAAPAAGVILSDVNFGPMGEAGPSALETINHFIDDMTRPRFIKDWVGSTGDPSLTNAVNSTWRTYDPVTGATFSSTSGTQDFTLVARELQMVDQRVVSKFRFGHTSVTAGNLLKVRSTAIGILCYVDPTQLFIFLGVSGGGGALSASGPIAVPLVINTDYWLESKIVGNVITHKVYDADPDIGAPVARGSLTYTLLSTNAGTLGAGRHGAPGIRAAPNAAAGASINFRQVRMTAL